ncbi:hypothetical protein KIH39_19315 [Telmatocola sphagniphila]|uniref:Uncharacterized protein n=1 Tax=Telmatocola sphagniphila TaxID=1123043 RepID=A0A8E6B466_9BACT|nr:hypothetical protein [Telmatocola sphagniphila]QVL30984.1 hypothetical protein KIH39_19315 [Telmatocola sphagniphila]
MDHPAFFFNEQIPGKYTSLMMTDFTNQLHMGNQELMTQDLEALLKIPSFMIDQQHGQTSIRFFIVYNRVGSLLSWALSKSEFTESQLQRLEKVLQNNLPEQVELEHDKLSRAVYFERLPRNQIHSEGTQFLRWRSFKIPVPDSAIKRFIARNRYTPWEEEEFARVLSQLSDDILALEQDPIDLQGCKQKLHSGFAANSGNGSQSDYALQLNPLLTAEQSRRFNLTLLKVEQFRLSKKRWPTSAAEIPELPKSIYKDEPFQILSNRQGIIIAGTAGNAVAETELSNLEASTRDFNQSLESNSNGEKGFWAKLLNPDLRKK